MIIATTGEAGTGKDTVADYLIKEHGFIRRGFADGIYEEVSKSFGVPIKDLKNRDLKEKPLPQLSLECCDNDEFIKLMESLGHHLFAAPRSPRVILQTWGTELRRAKDPDYWVNKLSAELAQLQDVNIVISDVRFDNEAAVVHGADGVIVKTLRNITRVNAHNSENGINPDYVAVELDNNKDFEHLHAQINGVLFQYDSLQSQVAKQMRAPASTQRKIAL